MIFETKKVPLETLGEYLGEVRNHLHLSIEDVAEKTAIAEKFLQYLEAGAYHKLPPDVYVYGFLKKLAELYVISNDVLVSQYRKERGIVEQLASEKLAPKHGLKTWASRLVVTPKLISLFGGIGLSFIAVFYIAFQVSAINRAPVLEVEQPITGSVVRDSVVVVAGHTDPGTAVAINGQNVFVDTQGKFLTTLGAGVGQNELTITAQNKYGKISSQKVMVMVEAPVVASAGLESSTQDATAETLSLEIKFTQETTITITKDGVVLPEEVVPADGVKRIDAEKIVIVRTSDAGSTLVTVNGKELGPLGRKQETLTVPFTINEFK